MDLCEPLQEMFVIYIVNLKKTVRENVSDCEGYRVTSAF